MRDRLIELLGDFPIFHSTMKKRWMPEAVERLADHLLANGVIVLPFPIGTTYYRIVTKRGKVGNPYFKAIRTAELNWYNVERVLQDLGKILFLTREEAEEALKEMLKES